MRQELTQVVQQICLKDSTRGSLRGMTQGVLSHLNEAKNRAFCFKKSGKQIAEPVKITIEKIRDAFTPLDFQGFPANCAGKISEVSYV